MSVFLGGLSLWLVVWLVVVKPAPVQSCPHLCVCYPSPMTVSCQAQNFTVVPTGVPYESQRVFLQNNRITELRVGSFGFGTQVCESIRYSFRLCHEYFSRKVLSVNVLFLTNFLFSPFFPYRFLFFSHSSLPLTSPMLSSQLFSLHLSLPSFPLPSLLFYLAPALSSGSVALLQQYYLD